MSYVAAGLVVGLIAAVMVWAHFHAKTVNTAIPTPQLKEIEADFEAKKKAEAQRIESESQADLLADLNHTRRS